MQTPRTPEGNIDNKLPHRLSLSANLPKANFSQQGNLNQPERFPAGQNQSRHGQHTTYFPPFVFANSTDIYNLRLDLQVEEFRSA
jgi:hypothetical protein